MKVSLDVPDALATQLAGQAGDLSRAALEALATEAYRAHRLSDFELRQLLDIPTQYEFDGFLKARGVMLDYTIEDLEREREISKRLREKRRAELAGVPER